LRFRRALRQPQETQARKLEGYVQRNAHTSFGKAHRFDSIRTYEEFSRRVPLSDYNSLEPWIIRIQNGENEVITSELVTHLVPTSGSTGARKLIPFTRELQREFNAAIAPWLVDLQRQFPGLLGGPAYWSITPATKATILEKSAVPIGFDSDTAYLGGTRQWLAKQVMAVPADLQNLDSFEAFRYRSLLHLLRCRELRLISVWHPSFLTLLLDALPVHWENLLSEIAHTRGSLVGRPRCADELCAIGPGEPAKLWPELRVISCWGDGNAETAIAQLETRFSEAFIQRKGLLATEAVVTIPFLGSQLLAVRSHFFEFMDDQGRIRLSHELRKGADYEVVITTGGGLWRYRLQDRVRVTGSLAKTPCLQFLGRSGNVSDRFGEKLVRFGLIPHGVAHHG